MFEKNGWIWWMNEILVEFGKMIDAWKEWLNEKSEYIIEKKLIWYEPQV
jgi:hypothetical protein